MTVWKAGMLAVCVHDGPWFDYDLGGKATTGPDYGDVLRVIEICIDYGVPSLRLEGWREDTFTAECFRPAVQDDQPCEEAFTALLNRSKPAKKTHPQSEATRSVLAGLRSQLSHGAPEPAHSRNDAPHHALSGNSNSNSFVPLHAGDI